MRCYYHQTVDAVALCKNCLRGLCSLCAADLANGTACVNRCEAQVTALNEVIERNKTGYEKAGGAYARNAILYGLLGVAMCAIGAFTLPAGYLMMALGAVMFVGAAFSYTTSKKMRRVGP